MSTNKQIQTYNQLENKSIQLIIERLPAVSFFCTSTSIPGVSTTAARQPSPFVDIKHTGDKLVFQPLIVNFIVDENLQNWQEVFDWMVSFGHPDNFDQYKDNTVTQNNLYRSKLSGGKLLVPNNKYNTSHEYDFEDLVPIDLSDIIIDVQTQSTDPIIATVTFEYTKYTKVK